ncbi:hypothetical protein GS942_21400 [Rhodococcus hoagii]|nr:hypothetical protein [Prescottella equi]
MQHDDPRRAGPAAAGHLPALNTFATTDHVGPLEYCADCGQLVDHYDGAQSTHEQGGGAMRGFWNALVIWGCLMAIVAMLVAIGTGWWWV